MKKLVCLLVLAMIATPALADITMSQTTYATWNDAPKGVGAGVTTIMPGYNSAYNEFNWQRDTAINPTVGAGESFKATFGTGNWGDLKDISVLLAGGSADLKIAIYQWTSTADYATTGNMGYTPGTLNVGGNLLEDGSSVFHFNGSATPAAVKFTFTNDNTWDSIPITNGAGYVFEITAPGQANNAFGAIVCYDTTATAFYTNGNLYLSGSQGTYSTDPQNTFGSRYGAAVRDLAMVVNVPEPATMALLGLGSLALLRRKK